MNCCATISSFDESCIGNPLRLDENYQITFFYIEKDDYYGAYKKVTVIWENDGHKITDEFYRLTDEEARDMKELFFLYQMDKPNQPEI